jgi:hypothetical protein
LGIHHQVGKVPLAAAGLAAAGLALAGCSAAPAGATNESLAVGPIRTGAALDNFAPFQVPVQWRGEGNVLYTMVVKARAGTKPREFGVKAAPSMVFWLGCLGAGGSVTVVSAPIKLKWSAPCSSDADPTGITFAPPRAEVGKKVKVMVSAPSHAKWLFRADSSAPSKAELAAAKGTPAQVTKSAKPAKSAKPS